MFSILRLYCVAILAGTMWAVPFSVQAQAAATVPTIMYGANSGTVTMAQVAAAGAAFRTFVAAAGVAGGVYVKDAVVAKIGSAAGVAMTAARLVPWTQVALMSARAVPYIAAAGIVGSLAVGAYQALRCTANTDGSMTGLMCQAGTSTFNATMMCAGGGANLKCDASPMAAALAYAPGAYPGYRVAADGDPTCPVQPGFYNQYCFVRLFANNNPSDTGTRTNIAVYSSVQPTCGSYMMNGISTRGTIGSDGKCSNGSPPIPTTFDQAATLSAQYSDKTAAPAMVREAAPYVNPLPLATAVPMTGPAQVVGIPATSTKTSSTGVVTSTTTTPTYNITYAGDTYTYSTVNNTTFPDGSTASDTAPTDLPKTQCELAPDSVGCASLGGAPAADAIPNAPVNITYTPTMFGGSSGCPAAVPMNFSIAGMNKSYSISYDPLCNLMTTLAPIFLALGAASAAIIFMDGLKS